MDSDYLGMMKELGSEFYAESGNRKIWYLHQEMTTNRKKQGILGNLDFANNASVYVVEIHIIMAITTESKSF